MHETVHQLDHLAQKRGRSARDGPPAGSPRTLQWAPWQHIGKVRIIIIFVGIIIFDMLIYLIKEAHYMAPNSELAILAQAEMLCQSPETGGIEDVEFEDWTK